MAIRFSEQVGDFRVDRPMADPWGGAYFGLQSGDMFEGAPYSFTFALYVGGDGGDLYYPFRGSFMLIDDQGGAGTDRLSFPDITLVTTAIIDDRHLVITNGPHTSLMVIIDYMAPGNVIEEFNSNGIDYTTAEALDILLSPGRFQGATTWEALTWYFPTPWSTADADEALAFYSARAQELATTGPLERIGTAGADILSGNISADQLDGREGDDQLSGGLGDDTVYGGSGNDYIAGEPGNDLLVGDDGADWLWAGNGNDTLIGGNDKDNINGEAGDDSIEGGDGNDRITGHDGDDVIYAGGGDDWVGVWNDWGEDPARNYFPEAGNDIIHGQEGNDVLSAGFGNDTVYGGAGNDYLAGEQGDDFLADDAGDNWFWGGDGNDSFSAGSGRDNLNGEGGNDWISAGGGNDRITGQAGDDTIQGGDGNDWVGVWNDWGEDPALNYFPESGNDRIHGEGGDDVLSAGTGDDTVLGGSGNDYVGGEQDNDLLFGGDGVDWLWAGAGDDTLVGSGGDILIGESGADIFAFGPVTDIFSSFDTVLDFNAAEGDRVDLSAVLHAHEIETTDPFGPFGEAYLTLMQGGDDVLLFFDPDAAGNDATTILAKFENLQLEDLPADVFDLVYGPDNAYVIVNPPPSAPYGGGGSGGSVFQLMPIAPLGDISFVSIGT